MPRAFLFSSNRYLVWKKKSKNGQILEKSEAASNCSAIVFPVAEGSPLDLSPAKTELCDPQSSVYSICPSSPSPCPSGSLSNGCEEALCSSNSTFTSPVPVSLATDTSPSCVADSLANGRPKRKRPVKRRNSEFEEDFDVEAEAELETKSSDYENNTTDEERFVCQECGKKYTTASNLTRHRQTHRSILDKTARKCPHCERIYVSSPAYNMHIQTHVQSCECPHCQKRFSRQWLLQGHMRTHTGEKPFQCNKCKKRFADKSNLRAHIQTHSEEKPHLCAHCGKSFALRSYLTKHEEASCGKTTK